MPSRRSPGAVSARSRGRGPLMAAARLIVGAAAIWVVLSIIGLILARVFDKGPVHSADLGVDVWFVHHRTGTWDSIMRIGTDMARTETVVVVAAVTALLLRWLLGRWRESLILVTAVTGEVLIFLAVAATVPQRRPPVPRLQVAAAVLFCIPVFVGISRLYEGEHYPSDVLAGALLASLWLAVVLHVDHRFLPVLGSGLSNGRARG